MRWASTLLAAAATGALGTNAFETSIFTFHDRNHLADKIPGQQTVSEDVARLILELRMKSPLESMLGEAETDTVDRLNHFAGGQSSLFGGLTDQDGSSRSILFLEGVDQEIGSSLRSDQFRSLFVPGVFSDFTNDASLNNDNGKHCLYHKSQNSPSIQECLANDPVLSHGRGLLNRDIIDLVDSMETSMSDDTRLSVSRLVIKATSRENALLTKYLQSTFQSLDKRAKSINTEITVVLVPAIDHSQGSTRTLRRTLENRSRHSVSDSNTRPLVERSAQSLSLSLNLAPVCHASNSSCAEATNDCSGHGSCFLKYGSGSEGATGNCYACRCRQTVVKKSDGSTKKIQWGGVACQKEDISSPFFLIAGVTVLVVILAGSAVGMLFSMGQEELPSVIGAGVGTSKPQS
ncbi:hypothetical protein N7532_006124 [Penicillium argentinense]|uniref:Vacuolar sorting protein Vps3844 C-terminal domain-containing protein n=1 Tax=Penicillium argentinense TaxID=1131581 RepID=A0A9W9FF71_9EURO|nr:uncharacterized protein N7532_006124 [Penicillium argentinense]KAJ5099123.1 hypothetical protein N7532_006124 [Penicillium argentinense]